MTVAREAIRGVAVARGGAAVSLVALVALLVARADALAAQSNYGIVVPPLPEQPVVFASAEVPAVRAVPLVTGLDHPWGMAFRKNGDILVTERDAGKLRVISEGRLLERDVGGMPKVYSARLRAGLMDVAVHPDDDALVYLTYSKPVVWEGEEGFMTVALARGRLSGDALTDVRDIFVAEGIDLGIAASKLIFAPDGTLFMSVGGSYVFAGTGELAQDPGSHYGKLLRLNADGSVPADNPFVDDPAYEPEIYTLGHRNQIGLAYHPTTGELWATENGPQGGDEANIIRAGLNYGWPLSSESREYNGRWISQTPWLPQYERPQVLWWPSVAPSGLAFYTGERFPAWRGNLFVGSLMVGRIAGTGHLERIVFNARGEEIRREWLLAELKQRIRDVRQGPDGYLYLLTDEDNGALLRLEPASVP
ncbi:MAG: PQQ-dependent sugar dehydrogenase [Gemmatimonadetes bacterium]|nr:PQQ-dependent sugar dehydrogenase [Gemmatimonadota bacterium]